MSYSFRWVAGHAWLGSHPVQPTIHSIVMLCGAGRGSVGRGGAVQRPGTPTHTPRPAPCSHTHTHRGIPTRTDTRTHTYTHTQRCIRRVTGRGRDVTGQRSTGQHSRQDTQHSGTLVTRHRAATQTPGKGRCPLNTDVKELGL